MKKFRVLYFGSWGYGKSGLEGLLKCNNVEIVKVFTKWEPAQTDNYLEQVKKLALFNGLEIENTLKKICPVVNFNKSILEKQNIDFIISSCFDRIFNEQIIRFPKIKALNIHPSLLPKYRGVKPLENAILNREILTGITLHELDKEIDGGKIVLQKAGIEIKPFKTYKELYDEQCNYIFNIVIEFFKSPLTLLSKSVQQDENNISWAPRCNFEIKDNMIVSEIQKIAKIKL